MNLNSKENKVNGILMALNPLKVSLSSLESECVEYIPELIRNARELEDIKIFLYNMTTGTIGLDISPQFEKKFFSDIEKVSNEVFC